MARIVCWAVTVGLALGACSSKRSDSTPARSQRERDSILGASQLPGARGVRGALGAADSAAARNARIDSIATSR